MCQSFVTKLFQIIVKSIGSICGSSSKLSNPLLAPNLSPALFRTLKMRRQIIAVERVRQATDGSGVVLTRRNQARSRSLRPVTRGGEE